MKFFGVIFAIISVVLFALCLNCLIGCSNNTSDLFDGNMLKLVASFKIYSFLVGGIISAFISAVLFWMDSVEKAVVLSSKKLELIQILMEDIKDDIFFRSSKNTIPAEREE